MNQIDQPNPDDWDRRLFLIEDMMRDMSRHTDPQAMVESYAERVRQFFPVRRRLSLSRRGMAFPHFRITRSTTWSENINPWKEKDRLPALQGGLLAELIYGDKTAVLDDLTWAADDPAGEYFAGQRSLLAIPMFDQGESLNMVVLFHEEPNAFPREQIPDLV